MRYREENNAFVVRSMTVEHHREALYGEPLSAATWVSRMRREMLSTREVRVSTPKGPLATARQEWVHVDASLAPARAPRSLLDAFPVESGPEGDLGPKLEAIETEASAGTLRVFEFDAWWTWMDPLDHANHPAYVDWCDEAISRVMHEAGIAPVNLVPVAEELTFRSGVRAGERVRVETSALGHTASGAAVLGHRILVGERLAVSGTAHRRLVGEEGRSRLLALF